jgi:glyoxylase-like metal-dependent hydrolase (beta-lactamase superfamily II)
MILINQFEEVTQIKMSLEVDGRPVYWTAAYLVDRLLIDTGPKHTAEELARFLEEQKLDFAVNTHWHEDHVGANKLLQQRRGIEIFAHWESVPIIGQFPNLPPYREWVWGIPESTKVSPLPDEIHTDHYHFDVIETPGHSEGHVALVEPKKGWCFSGDLFVSEKPKVNHPKAKLQETIKSMKKLAELKTKRLILFTSPGRIFNDGRKALKTCIDYLQDLSQKAKNLEKEGLSVTAIREELIGEESSLAQVSKGELSSENLIRFLLYT